MIAMRTGVSSSWKNASEALVKEIEKLAANQMQDLLDCQKSTTTLERLFLEATQRTRITR